MKNKSILSFFVLPFTLAAALPADAVSQQIIRPQRLIRGSTSQAKLSLFDSAAWITHADLADEIHPKALRIVRFKCPFKVEDASASFEIDVSADERFYLSCDGKFIGRGPHRGTESNWMFQSYKLNLEKGDHVIEAVVWKHSDGNAPLAQLSVRLGFALAASGKYAQRLTTGVACLTMATSLTVRGERGLRIKPLEQAHILLCLRNGRAWQFCACRSPIRM